MAQLRERNQSRRAGDHDHCFVRFHALEAAGERFTAGQRPGVNIEYLGETHRRKCNEQENCEQRTCYEAPHGRPPK
jgi:hypothetical protein